MTYIPNLIHVGSSFLSYGLRLGILLYEYNKLTTCNIKKLNTIQIISIFMLIIFIFTIIFIKPKMNKYYYIWFIPCALLIGILVTQYYKNLYLLNKINYINYFLLIDRINSQHNINSYNYLHKIHEINYLLYYHHENIDHNLLLIKYLQLITLNKIYHKFS